MTCSDYAARMRQKRELYEDFSRIMDEIEGDGGFMPSQDVEFWRDFNRIEAAGRDKNEGEVPWLASLTQVDDLGPMGRALFLASAALEALRQMPVATLAAGKTLCEQIAPDASQYRKVGVCLVLEASASAEAIPLLERLIEDDNPYVQQEGKPCLERLRAQISLRAEPESSNSCDTPKHRI